MRLRYSEIKTPVIDRFAPDDEEDLLTKLRDEDKKEEGFSWVNCVFVSIYFEVRYIDLEHELH